MPPARAWEARHAEVLARWPVLGEAWAKAVEEHRRSGQPGPPQVGRPRDEERAITPREAIDRALGLGPGRSRV